MEFLNWVDNFDHFLIFVCILLASYFFISGLIATFFEGLIKYRNRKE